MKKAVCFIILLLISIQGLSLLSPPSAYAAEVIRLENTVKPDGKIEKKIQISSRNRDFFSEENPLLPSDPVWKMGEVKKNGDMYVQEGTAVVDGATNCLSFEHLEMNKEKEGIFTKISYSATLNYDKKLRSSNKYQTMAFMVTPIAREIAAKADSDPETIAKIVQMSGFAIDKVDQIYKTIKLTELIGNTEIHYRVNLPEPGLFVNKKDLDPEVSRTFTGRDLFRDGTGISADTKFLQPALANVFLVFIIFAILVISGALFMLARKKNHEEIPKDSGDIQPGSFQF